MNNGTAINAITPHTISCSTKANKSSKMLSQILTLIRKKAEKGVPVVIKQRSLLKKNWNSVLN